MDTTRLLSMFRNSASIRSSSSGARICRKETAAYFLPMRKVRVSLNSKEDGAIKSLVDRPEGASHFQSKRNGSCVSMWNMACIRARRSFPSRELVCAPKRLKLLRISSSTRSSRSFAVR